MKDPTSNPPGPDAHKDTISPTKRLQSQLIDLVKAHPAVALTTTYLLASFVGVVYNWLLFRKFGINIFDYAETNDFLLAAFRDPYVIPMIIYAAAIALGIPWLIGRFGWIRFPRGIVLLVIIINSIFSIYFATNRPQPKFVFTEFRGHHTHLP